jgi:hypothetical protein
MHRPDPDFDSLGDPDNGRRGREDRPDNGSMSRRVSVAPSGRDGDRGTVVVSRDNPKKKISRTEPVRSNIVPLTATAAASNGNRTEPQRSVEYSAVRRESQQVRYRSDSKQQTSRAGPVAARNQAPSVSNRVEPSSRTSRSSPVLSDSRRDSMTVRSPNSGKVRQSRIQPAPPSGNRQASAPRVVVSSPPARSAVAPRSVSPPRSAPSRRSVSPPRSTPPSSAGRVSRAPKASAPRAKKSTPRVSAKTRDRDRD